LNNGDFYETHGAYRLALIHSIAVQIDNLSSKLLTNTHQMHHYGSSFTKILYLTDLTQKLLSLRRDS